MTEHDNADEVTRLRAEVEVLRSRYADACAAMLNMDRLVSEATHDAEAAEAALTRVRELAERLKASGVVSVYESALEIGQAIEEALDPASPATRPSPAPADDEGTGTGAAPSEGHSGAQGGRERADAYEGLAEQWRDRMADAEERAEIAEAKLGDGGAP